MSIQALYLYRENLGSLESITVHTSPVKVLGNFLKLRIITDRVNTIDFINNILQGVELKVRDDRFSKSAEILILKSKDARKVVDLLYQGNELSVDNRANIETSLRIQKKCVKHAKKINDNVELTAAQKDIIEYIVTPYIEEIKEEAPDIEFTNACISSARINLQHAVYLKYGSITKKDLHVRLRGCYYFQKSASFQDSLFSLARVWISKAELEDTFIKTGETLPSERQIGDVIYKTVDKIYNIDQKAVISNVEKFIKNKCFLTAEAMIERILDPEKKEQIILSIAEELVKTKDSSKAIEMMKKIREPEPHLFANWDENET